MTGQAHWIEGFVVILGGLLVMGGIYLLGIHHTLKRVRRRLACPVSGEPVQVAFIEDTTTGRFLDVVGCSAFPDPDDVRCAKTCRIS
jgi:hypothetical protein